MSHGVAGVGGLPHVNSAVDIGPTSKFARALIIVVDGALAERTNMLALFISMHWRGSDYSCLAK